MLCKGNAVLYIYIFFRVHTACIYLNKRKDRKKWEKKCMSLLHWTLPDCFVSARSTYGREPIQCVCIAHTYVFINGCTARILKSSSIVTLYICVYTYTHAYNKYITNVYCCICRDRNQATKFYRLGMVFFLSFFFF